MTDFRSPTLREVCKAQVAFLYGRLRPVGGQSEDEQKAVAAERTEFAERLYSYVKALEAPEHALIKEVRRVAQEFHGAAGVSMPTPEQVASRIKSAFLKEQPTPECAGCKAMGGYYLHVGDDEPLYEGRRDGPRAPWPRGLFLCVEHHLAANWYAWREDYHRRGKAFVGVPPYSLMPRSWKAYQRDNVAPYTDGGMMGPMARWARQFVMETYDFSLPLLVEREAQPLLPAEAAPPESLPEV